MGELRLRQWRSLLSLSRLNEDPRAKEERRSQYGAFGVPRLFRLRHRKLGATDGKMHIDATGLLPKPQTALKDEEMAGLQLFFAGIRAWPFNTSKLLPLSLSTSRTSKWRKTETLACAFLPVHFYSLSKTY
ncbi:hypothetical protein V2G26_000648 [Clonostachys chloroleuca]